MKYLLIFISLISFNVFAEDECVFDESSYVEFIKEYELKHKDSRIESDGKTLTVERNNEKIVVGGGGCVHLGISIDLKSSNTYTEEQFLEKTLMLTREFGSWLISEGALDTSIKNRKFQVIDGIYYVEVDVMTVFSATYTINGDINIEFYIN